MKKQKSKVERIRDYINSPKPKRNKLKNSLRFIAEQVRDGLQLD